MRRVAGLRGLIALFVTVGFVVLLDYGLAANRPARALDQAIAKGRRDRAPGVTLPSVSTGATLSLGQFRGRVVLVNIWASWCGPCQSEAPLLERWYKRISALGGTVVGIDTFDARSDAVSFVHKFDLTYPQLRDPAGVAKSKFGVTGFPESFVIDRDGRVAAIERGPVDDAFMQGTVQALLEERS